MAGQPLREDEASERSLSDWSATRAADEKTPVAEAPAPAPASAFTPGTILAGRYRVVAPLGRGGMGEVYRADDLKLGQAVALKFVRGDLAPELRDRLLSEVRLGRQIAHPAVCRLYDVVEVGGDTFIAMEYVDGEDLASLLARIGRLPPDKAIDVARDLCGGLSAVHEKGIVHRDLKPANVMIDGRGKARLTDFGLAILAEGGGAQGFAGTPSYMAPEQLAGGTVTARSDLYALGLILYEMLTGRRFFDARTIDELSVQHRAPKSTRLQGVPRPLDAAVERALIQCLEEDPQARPASARAVLALLPGGDPLDVAVAAGETPSPEAVAAATRVGDLSAGAAWAALVGIVVLVLFAAWQNERSGLLRSAMFPKPPELLRERAREVLVRLGHPRGAVDSAGAFDWDPIQLRHVSRTDRSADRWVRLSEAPIPPAFFFYRESPMRLVALNRDGRVRPDDPPLDVSGMTEVVLTPSGRLLRFIAVPPEMDEAREAWPEPDWRPLLQEAGLDPAALRVVPPRWAAPVDSDRKAAWEGAYAGHPQLPLRIEAAAYHGRPVWFAVLPPWAIATRTAHSGTPLSPTPVGDFALWILALAMPVGGVLLARHNLRLGRGDRKGAFRVALFVFVTYTIARLLRADHVGAFVAELWVLIKVIAYPTFWAAQVWLLYMALEPYARRRWPRMLISWKRLLSGNFRDPMVGRDILMGALAGAVVVSLFLIGVHAATLLGDPAPLIGPFVAGETLTSIRQAAFRPFVNLYSSVLFAMAFLFVFVLLRLILKRDWLAMAAWCVMVGGPMVGDNPSYGWISGIVRAAVLFLVLMRAGLLGIAFTLFTLFLFIEVPFSLDLSAWYVAHALPAFAVWVPAVLFAFHTSLGGKPLLGQGLLED
ncbi:MAG TPA: serine/threonine-protein kinase [Vicinamibacteria bacterium]|nr:serine/threonine-protein kinase [Vicinamibacteria bacterium]